MARSVRSERTRASQAKLPPSTYWSSRSYVLTLCPRIRGRRGRSSPGNDWTADLPVPQFCCTRVPSLKLRPFILTAFHPIVNTLFRPTIASRPLALESLSEEHLLDGQLLREMFGVHSRMVC